MDLTRRSASGAAWVGSAGLASQAIGLVTSFVLARLLTPEEFGLVAMVAPIIVVLWVFLELGLSTATIQKKDLTKAESSLVFWINCSLAVVAWGALSAGSGLIAAFYGKPLLRALVVVYGLVIIGGGLISQPRALLVRNMRFRVLAGVDLGSTVFASTLAVWAGRRGWGPWAIVVLALSPKVVQTVGFWATSGFRPLVPRWVHTARAMFAFGVNLSVYRLLDQVAGNMDAVLVGRVWGAAPVGYYSRARRLTQNPLVLLHSYLGTAIVPALCRLQDEPQRLGTAYLRACRALAALTFPVACCLFVLAPDAIRLAYGKQWAPCIPIFRALCLVSLSEAVMRSLEWVYVASGRTDRLLRWTLVSVPAICLAYAVGVRWSALGAAVSFAVVWNALLLPGVWYALRTVGVGLREAGRYFGAPLLSSVLAAAGTWAVLSFLPRGPEAVVIRAATGTATMAVLYLGLIALVGRGVVADLQVVLGAILTRPPSDAPPLPPLDVTGAGGEA